MRIRSIDPIPEILAEKAQDPFRLRIHQKLGISIIARIAVVSLILYIKIYRKQKAKKFRKSECFFKSQINK